MIRVGKKIFALLFIVLSLVLIAPKTSLAAGLATFETNPIFYIEKTYQLLTSEATQKLIGQKIYEWSYKFATETLKDQLLNMVVDQIVKWIQGGGEPKFITDWPAFFRDAVDQAGGKFLQQKLGTQICSAFRSQLKAAFIPIPSFTERTSCTLSQIGINLEAFLENFENGGWVAWREMVLKPQNNIYGAYIMAWDEYETDKAIAEKVAAAEAQAGQGFLSVKQCVEWDSSQAVEVCGEVYSDCVAQGSSNQECGQLEAQCYKENQICLKEQINTPGSVVGAAAAEVIGAPIKRIVSAQQLEGYISAIANATLYRIFAEDVGLLRAALTSETTSGSSSAGSSAQIKCSALLETAAYNDCVSSIQSGANIRDFQKDYIISQINQELEYQNQLLRAKQATLIVLNQSVGDLNQLAVCQKSNASSTLDILKQVQNSVASVKDDAAKIQSDIIALQTKQQEVAAVTDPTQIPIFWSQTSQAVNPAITYSLVLSAQQETAQKQQDSSFYQDQLFDCQNPDTSD